MLMKGKWWVDWQTHDTVGVWQVCDMTDEDMMQNEDMLNDDVPADIDIMMMNNCVQDRGEDVDVLMDDMKFDEM